MRTSAPACLCPDLGFTPCHSAATRCPPAHSRLQGCSARKGHGSALTALGALAGLRELHVHALGGCEAGALEAMLAGLTGLKALSLSAPTPAAAAPALSALQGITGLRTLHVRRPL